MSLNDCIELRHYLHQHPEVSQQEKETHRYLFQKLKALAPDDIKTVAATGILVVFYGKRKGKNILFRADMDALPIEETITGPYVSTNEKVSHKCGHDGHSAVMFGLAQYFADSRPDQGNAVLLFQPAEENGWGARAVMESKILENLSIDYTVAFHNLPGFPLHQIVCKSGSFTSAVVSIAITFKGYTAHAAEPWNGRNPTVAIARFTLEALLLNKENKEQHRYITVTPVYTKVGSRNYGISAGEGTVHLTVRANDQQQLKVTLDQLRMIAEEQAAQQDLEVSFDYIEPFEANQNDEAVVTLIQQAAQANGFSYYEREEPFRWGEDFGLFTQVYKGAMFGIGSGESCPPLHHPAYDFPDAIIETGMKMFIAIQEKAQV